MANHVVGWRLARMRLLAPVLKLLPLVIIILAIGGSVIFVTIAMFIVSDSLVDTMCIDCVY